MDDTPQYDASLPPLRASGKMKKYLDSMLDRYSPDTVTVSNYTDHHVSFELKNNEPFDGRAFDIIKDYMEAFGKDQFNAEVSSDQSPDGKTISVTFNGKDVSLLLMEVVLERNTPKNTSASL